MQQYSTKCQISPKTFKLARLENRKNVLASDNNKLIFHNLEHSFPWLGIRLPCILSLPLNPTTLKNSTKNVILCKEKKKKSIMFRNRDKWKNISDKEHVNRDKESDVEVEGEETRAMGCTFGGNN